MRPCCRMSAYSKDLCSKIVEAVVGRGTGKRRPPHLFGVSLSSIKLWS